MGKLAMTFRENTYSLNDLIGYVELADSYEILPQHSLSIKEQKGCQGISIFWIFHLLKPQMQQGWQIIRYCNFMGLCL